MARSTWKGIVTVAKSKEAQSRKFKQRILLDDGSASSEIKIDIHPFLRQKLIFLDLAPYFLHLGRMRARRQIRTKVKPNQMHELWMEKITSLNKEWFTWATPHSTDASLCFVYMCTYERFNSDCGPAAHQRNHWKYTYTDTKWREKK